MSFGISASPYDEDFDSNEPWREGFAPAAPAPAGSVYTTAGGRRFHADDSCRALWSGQSLNDWEFDYEFPPPAAWTRPTLWAIEPRQPIAAALTGYTACRVCVPTANALPATGQTYGHEPVIETGYYGPEQVCARCNMPRLPMLSQPWPCTSAVVLGLAITDADRWNARYPVGTPVTAYPATRTDEPLRTRTRTPAWRLHSGDSLVSVDGYAGGICLTHIDPRGGA
jgi:hypothetical protein